MKKLLLTLALVLGATTVSAQEVGSLWVGGSVGISSTKVSDNNIAGVKVDGDRRTSFKILPEIGYVMAENVGLGVRLGYADSKNGLVVNNVGYGEAKAFTINPFVRYSFLKGEIGSLFIDGGIGYTNVNVKNVDKKANSFDVGFKPGVAINVSDNVKVLGHFGFLGYTNTKQGDYKNDSFGLDLDMTQFTVGVNYHF